jgi:hypothetical protein
LAERLAGSLFYMDKNSLTIHIIYDNLYVYLVNIWRYYEDDSKHT